MRITRGLPQLRTLRDIMEHIYALFDRRCRTQTALGKLRKLRQWVPDFSVSLSGVPSRQGNPYEDYESV